MLKILSQKIQINLYRSSEHVELSDLLGVGLIISNSSFLSSLNLRCFLTISNDYYNEKCDQIISVPVVAKSKNTNPIICEVNSCGTIVIKINKGELTDLFGLFSCIIEYTESISIDVFPTQTELSEVMKLGILEGYSDNEDDTKKGNEYSDTSNIREYVPGDRIKDIHWKLSSKRDILLVREHIKTCENKLVLWIDRSPRKKNNEKILSLVCAIIKYAIAEGVYLKVLWMAHNNSDINESIVISNDNMKDTLIKIYLDSTLQNIDDIRSLLIENNYKANTILRVGYKESEVTVYSYEI